MNFAGHFLHLPRLTWPRGIALAMLMLLAGCGFTMRGVTPLPFDTLYVGIPDNTRFGADVRRALRAASPNTRLVAGSKEAQAILQQVSTDRTLREVSLNAQGRVEEYELGIDYTFRLIDAKGNALVPDTTVSIYREMPYDDQVVQAKQGQIDSLYQSMEKELVNRLLRRLTAPDVHEAAAKAAAGTLDPDAPVYDPHQATPASRPSPWNTPNAYPGMGTP